MFAEKSLTDVLISGIWIKDRIQPEKKMVEIDVIKSEMRIFLVFFMNLLLFRWFCFFCFHFTLYGVKIQCKYIWLV